MVDLARAAADRAIAKLAFEDAERILERALAAVESVSGLDARRCDLLVALGEARILSGDDAGGKEACVRAAAIAKDRGDAESLARAALVYGTEILAVRRDDVMVALLRDALDALPTIDSPLRARVLARYGASLIPTPLPTEPNPLDLANEGLAMARRTGDRDALLHALRWWSATSPFDSPSVDRQRLALEMADIAAELGKKVVALTPLTQAILGGLDQGDVVAADSAVDALAARIAELPQPHYQWRLPMARATRAVMSGRFADGERLGREAMALLERAGMGDSTYGKIHLFGIEHARRDGALLDTLETVIAKEQGPGGRPFAAWVAAASGRRADAMQRTNALVERLPIRNIPPVLVMLGDVSVLLGWTEHAEVLYEFLKGQSVTNPTVWAPAFCAWFGPTVRTAGDLAVLLGRDDEAAAHDVDALDLAGGKIVEHWAERDDLGMMRQLGALPGKAS